MHRHLSPLLGLSLFCLINMATPLFAKPSSSPGSQGGSGDPPPQTAGPGTRDPDSIASCAVPTGAENQPELTPIVPQNQIISTEQEQVNLYVYIPPETNQPAALEVLDLKTQAVIFEQDFDLQTADTIARLVLPNSMQLMPTAETRYAWRLAVYCDPDSDAEIFVDGQIHRLETGDVASRLWHEDLEAWFIQRQTVPSAWQQGLIAENLGNYADHVVETYFLDN